MSVPTVAQDKLGVSTLVVDSTTIKAAAAKADSAQNIAALMQGNWNGSGDGIILQNDTWWIAGRVAPTSADYSNAPIGSLFFLFQADSTTTPVLNDADIYIKKSSGWVRLESAGQIAVYGSGGAYKKSYATIDLACAALANGDIIKLKAGEYTLTAAIDITKTDVQIIGVEPGVRIICAAAADYGFKTVFGAITATKGITFTNLEICAQDDATQQAIRIENTSATGRINVYIDDVDFESDGGDSIHVDHAASAASIRLYVQGGTIEGPVNFTVANTDDRIRFTDAQLLGGLVTGTSATAMEIALRNCIIKHTGVTGGDAAQLLYVMDCYTVTGGNPEVYAAFDGDDSAGAHTESLRFPQS